AAEAIGLRPTLWLVAVGMLLAAGWLIASPLPAMRDLPQAGDGLSPCPHCGQPGSCHQNPIMEPYRDRAASMA
ncbi:MAG: hypothetical protein M3319_11280, partial [Actinomycetota bacterium]|nr:hypothetical protein [Actinomycetota bacterium]